jgi:hypothetical protein
VQIGNSPEATAFLEELDDGLTSQYGIRVSYLILFFPSPILGYQLTGVARISSTRRHTLEGS